MFYHVNGKLVLCEANTAVVDCGGVGYQLTVSLSTASALSGKLGETVLLFTHLQVKEDGVELFGFGSKEELSFFRLLISVSGVGPKAAMAILSQLSPDKLAYAICTEDVKAISRANGVGTKTAARVVLELKDKISKEQLTGLPSAMSDAPAAPAAATGGKLGEAADALAVLGYTRTEISEALRGIDPAGKSVEQIITAALARFAAK